MMSTSLATLRWLAVSLAACALAVLGTPPAQAAASLTGWAGDPANVNRAMEIPLPLACTNAFFQTHWLP